MIVSDLTNLESLKSAMLISGSAGLDSLITSVNVLEAPDIENWGRSGQVILTSLVALNELSDEDLSAFFIKLKNIGISAIIVKIKRFVHGIPINIVALSEKYGIPLFQIEKSVKYESIILEILEPIINRNAYLLNKYYETHSQITRIALKNPSMREILGEFKKMIHRDLSLINISKGTQIGTNTALYDFTVQNSREIEREKYMFYTYRRNEVLYTQFDPPRMGYQISVTIPCPEFHEYELIIHEHAHPVSSEDFMVLENAVKFFQMELLKRHAVSQNLFQKKNSILNDLLKGRLPEEKSLDEVLEFLNIREHRHYQAIMIRLTKKDDRTTSEDSTQQILKSIRYRMMSLFEHVAYLEETDRIVFLANLDQDGLSMDALHSVIEQVKSLNLFKDHYYRVSVSYKVEKTDIASAHDQVLNTERILNLFYPPDSVLTFNDLGIYKLFLETNSLDKLEQFISPGLNAFHSDYPDLFETLSTFLDCNQHYIMTAKKLFLHPKTVRYRIDKIKSLISIDLENPEEVMHVQVAARLFKLIR